MSEYYKSLPLVAKHHYLAKLKVVGLRRRVIHMQMEVVFWTILTYGSGDGFHCPERSEAVD